MDGHDNRCLLAHERLKLLQRNVEYLNDRVSKVNEGDCEIVFNDRDFSDFKIIVGHETFYVSKCLLAQKSPVFKTMFKSRFNESIMGQLEMVDDPEAVKAMLLFIYEGKKVDNIDLAIDVIQLSHRYEIDILTIQCELYLTEKIKIDRAEECLALARQLNLDYLALKCYEVFFFNFDVSADRVRQNWSVSQPVVKKVVLNDVVENLKLDKLKLNGKKGFLLQIRNQCYSNCRVSYRFGWDVNEVPIKVVKSGEYFETHIQVNPQRSATAGASFMVFFNPLGGKKRQAHYFDIFF
ncbi:unnamed protein product [Bursaphelenchus okinawaensis]|uniref:BTB domain-containing protein n=1 Tax=Bursaphelenchus okinawaensis TaxID=465554 RepID=A0A811K560_9BILA|nr:unnamed protein product [Bursaphelenchus okinawaensis]CAG9090923.1 unnamed protein product [Bursaphelenchus okinawaensis]